MTCENRNAKAQCIRCEPLVFQALLSEYQMKSMSTVNKKAMCTRKAKKVGILLYWLEEYRPC